VVVDLAATNPAGWGSDHYRNTAHQTDASIYEVHIRDFSIDPNSGMKNRGKYLALTEHGTHTPLGSPTGIDSVKALGVSHIELLPIQGCATLDEVKGGSADVVQGADGTRYNWCYDPRNYNVPNGAYATDPTGAVRITEVKQMVQAIHKSGLGVIQDVVYPHTFSTSVFDPIVPGYYYRTDEAGNLLARTGVGNEVAAERPMVRKFILDSVKYWAREYHMDGFRFDQMAYLGKETTTQIAKELRGINPHAVMLGEPWSPDLGLPGTDVAMTKGQQKNLHVGVFNDDIRDGLTGDVFNPQVPGYATGAPTRNAPVLRSIPGNINYSLSRSGFAAQPDEAINYVSVHDGYTLWDHIATSAPTASEADRIKMDELAQAVVFTAQGVPYIEGGAEFLRTKGGNGNSYQAGDVVNMLTWGRKASYPQVVRYYTGLFHLRSAHPAFRMSTASAITKHLKLFDDTPQFSSMFELTGHANGDRWKNILVIYNPNNAPVKLSLPKGTWTIVANTGHAGVKALGHAKGKVSAPGLTVEVLYQ
jgi:pullulanase